MSGRRLVVLAAVTSSLLASGYGVMFTLLDDYRDSYGIQADQLGWVVGVGFFVSFLAQILLAPLADRGHAKRLIATGIAINVVGLIGMGFGRSIGPILVGRALTGLGVGMAIPALRKVVIAADPDNLGQNMGTLLAADVGGFALGPAVSAVIRPLLGIPAPYVVIAVATLAIVPVLLVAPVKEQQATSTDQRFAVDLLRSRPVAATVVMGLAVFVMIGMFDSLFSIVLDDMNAPGWIANAGIILFALPLLVLGRPGGRLTHRLGPFRISTLGLTMGALFMLSYGFWKSAYVMLAVGILHGVNDGLTVTGTGVAMGMVAPAHRQAGAQGLLGGTQTLCGGLSAILAGWLYENTTRTTTYAVCSALMLTLVLAGALLAGPTWKLRPTDNETPAEPSTASAVGQVATMADNGTDATL
jgi:MFS family permease